MQEAEIDSDRIKKRRRSTESGTDNVSALVPRQVRVLCLRVRRLRNECTIFFVMCYNAYGDSDLDFCLLISYLCRNYLN